MKHQGRRCNLTAYYSNTCTLNSNYNKIMTRMKSVGGLDIGWIGITIILVYFHDDMALFRVRIPEQHKIKSIFKQNTFSRFHSSMDFIMYPGLLVFDNIYIPTVQGEDATMSLKCFKTRPFKSCLRNPPQGKRYSKCTVASWRSFLGSLTKKWPNLKPY
jgi:hypothetical protein